MVALATLAAPRRGMGTTDGALLASLDGALLASLDGALLASLAG